MNVPVVNASGEEVGTVELSSVFSAKVNRGLMHQALVRQMANGRQGTHKAQTRAEVSRTTAKWYRQKGTGRARHGSRRAPIFVGGGVAHGPRPRKYTKRMPRKMRRGALRSALTVKAQGGDLVILDELAMAAPKTKDLVNVLKGLVGAESTLLLLPARDENVELSARNIPTVKAMQANYLNIRDLLGHQKLVISLASLDVIEDFLGDRGDEFAEFLAMDEEE
jgi:large subunit ribosomal protein L4